MSYRISKTEDGVLRYPMHSHKRCEIMLYLEGEGYMQTDGGDVPFSKGTVIIVPPNIRHGSVSKGGFKNISVEGDFEGYLNLDYAVSFSDNASGEGAALAELIYKNRYDGGAYLGSLCTAYVCFLLQRFEVENTIQRAIKKIVLEISENALDPTVSPTEILQKSGYSEDYIRAEFKKSTGKTPIEFLTEVRINHACFLLDIYKNDLSLSEIAEKCGYLDYVYFSKRFKEIKGMAPREYRS